MQPVVPKNKKKRCEPTKTSSGLRGRGGGAVTSGRAESGDVYRVFYRHVEDVHACGNWERHHITCNTPMLPSLTL